MLDEISQRKIFWLLKKYSSLSLWKRIHEAHQLFFQAVEHMVTHHPENDPDWMQIEIYKRSLNEQVNFENGLSRLVSGDRSVFHNNAEGSLYNAFSNDRSGSGYVIKLLNRGDCPDEWSYLGDLAWAATHAAEGGSGSLEPEEEEPAAWYPSWILLPENLPEYAFPEPLPPVPEAPMPPVLIQTGGELPVDGIYEPEGEGTCMNYLLGGTIAPTVMREYGELHESIFHKGKFIRSIETIPTTWRLIWADHRYEDGTVPEEEKDYFLPKPKGAVATPPEATGRALPGDRCPRAGFWYTHAKEGSRRRFEEGEVFPDFPDSAWGATIWYWDEHQSSE